MQLSFLLSKEIVNLFPNRLYSGLYRVCLSGNDSFVLGPANKQIKRRNQRKWNVWRHTYHRQGQDGSRRNDLLQVLSLILPLPFFIKTRTNEEGIKYNIF